MGGYVYNCYRCMCSHMCVQVQCMFVHVYVCTCLYRCICVCTCVYVCTDTYICTYVYMCIQVHICEGVHGGWRLTSGIILRCFSASFSKERSLREFANMSLLASHFALGISCFHRVWNYRRAARPTQHTPKFHRSKHWSPGSYSIYFSADSLVSRGLL